jgi:hypothetical protein
MAILAAALAVGIPLALWRYLLRDWKPVSRAAFGARYAAIAFALLTYALGGPLARAITGTQLPGLQTLPDALLGIVGLSVILMPVAFTVGYLVRGHPENGADVVSNEGSSDS